MSDPEITRVTWMRVQLDEQPQTFQEIQPNFLRELHQARHEDLRDPANAEDLEKLHRKALLQEFATYDQTRKRLKVFRTEAVRAGFAQAYAGNDFAAITEVAAPLLEIVVQEDLELLMYVDAVSLREEMASCVAACPFPSA